MIDDVLVKTRADLEAHPNYVDLVPAPGRIHAEIFVEVAYAAPELMYAAFGGAVARLADPWLRRGDGFGFRGARSTDGQ